MSGSEEKKFFAATPSGNITLNITNDIADQFELGADYYIDFTKAEYAPLVHTRTHMKYLPYNYIAG